MPALPGPMCMSFFFWPLCNAREIFALLTRAPHFPPHTPRCTLTMASKGSPLALQGLQRITAPAIVTMVGYAILVFIVLLPVDKYTYDDKTGAYAKQRYSFPFRLLVALLLLLPFILSVYSVNCMMVGNCTTWSWIVALITLLWAVVITVTTFTSGSFSLDQMV